MVRTLSLIAFCPVALATRDEFESWKQLYNRVYESEVEEAKRFSIFMAKLEYYAARNANDTATYGPDEFADRTAEEFRAARVGDGVKDDCLQSVRSTLSSSDVSAVLAEKGDSIDYRQKGAVTSVKNQGQYGTCWSFGSTGIMEGMSVIQGGNPLESISEQELIDCATSCYGYVGCTISTYYAPNHYHAITEETYPYRGAGGSCRRSSGTESKSKAKDVVCERNGANNNQDNVLAQLLKYGPGGFLVGSGCLDGYRGGVISNCGRTAGDIDHATLVVGAGEENGTPYWIVKNSWGESFGEQGYFRVARNTNPPQLGNPGGIFGVYDASAVTV